MAAEKDEDSRSLFSLHSSLPSPHPPVHSSIPSPNPPSAMAPSEKIHSGRLLSSRSRSPDIVLHPPRHSGAPPPPMVGPPAPPSPGHPAGLDSILGRLHNLEVLAGREGREVQAGRVGQVEGRKERGEREGGVVGRAEWRGRVDLGMMLARLEVIRSDFDVVAEVREPGSEETYFVKPGFPDLPVFSLLAHPSTLLPRSEPAPP